MLRYFIKHKKKVRLIPTVFNLGPSENSARLDFRRVHSNIFVVLTDYFWRPILIRTSGNSSRELKTKRRKKAVYALEPIIKQLIVTLQLYGITQVRIQWRMRINKYYYFLLTELAYYGIAVFEVHLYRIRAFNGTRSRKLRRL